MNSYLFVFDKSALGRDEIIDKIDKIDGIENWMLFFDNTACIVSELSAREIATLVRSNIPDIHFIITSLESSKRSGWLRKSVWNFIKDPKPVS